MACLVRCGAGFRNVGTCVWGLPRMGELRASKDNTGPLTGGGWPGGCWTSALFGAGPGELGRHEECRLILLQGMLSHANSIGVDTTNFRNLNFFAHPETSQTDHKTHRYDSTPHTPSPAPSPHPRIHTSRKRHLDLQADAARNKRPDSSPTQGDAPEDARTAFLRSCRERDRVAAPMPQPTHPRSSSPSLRPAVVPWKPYPECVRQEPPHTVAGTKKPRKRNHPATTVAPGAATPNSQPREHQAKVGNNTLRAANPQRKAAQSSRASQGCSGYQWIPTPTIVSYNMNGLSAEATSGKQLRRQERVIANLESVSRNADIVCLQESLAKEDAPIFRKLLRPAFHDYHNANPNSLHRGGTVIFVRKKLAKISTSFPKLSARASFRPCSSRRRQIGNALSSCPFWSSTFTSHPATRRQQRRCSRRWWNVSQKPRYPATCSQGETGTVPRGRATPAAMIIEPRPDRSGAL